MLITVALLIFSVAAGAAFPQDVQGSPQITSRMISLAEVLSSHGVTDLSEQSLISTLTNSNPQVRSVAAMKLAEDHHDDAAPAVESALSREQDLNAQIGLSEALWGLHSEKGIAHLRAMCTNSSLKLATLIAVVDALRLTHSRAGVCAETFFAAIGSAKEPGDIAMGETRLSAIYCDSTPEEARRIMTTLKLYLTNRKQEAQIRLEASQALADIGTSESEEAIRAAISQEQNPDYRMFFEATLKGLERNPHYCDSTRK